MSKVVIDDAMLISAVRYALPRMTYIVSWTVDEVIRVWDDLSENARHVIARDVKQAREDGVFGMPMDADAWGRLLDHVAVSEGETHPEALCAPLPSPGSTDTHKPGPIAPRATQTAANRIQKSDGNH